MPRALLHVRWEGPGQRGGGGGERGGGVGGRGGGWGAPTHTVGVEEYGMYMYDVTVSSPSLVVRGEGKGELFGEQDFRWLSVKRACHPQMSFVPL